MRKLFLIAALVFAAYLALLALDVEAKAAPGDRAPAHGPNQLLYLSS